MVICGRELVCSRHLFGRSPSLDRRRALASLAALGLSPLARGAVQPAEIPRAGALCFGSPGALKPRIAAFVERMRQLGYVENRTVRYEFRYANGQRDLLAGLAQELAAMKPDVIVSGSVLTTAPLMQATTAIPIVMVSAEEAIGASRQPVRPAANVTGTINNALESVPRSLYHLAVLLPGLARVAALVNASNAAHAAYRSTLEGAARAARVRCGFFETSAGTRDLAHAVERAAASAQAMIVMSDDTFYDERRAIVELAVMNRVPAMYPRRGYVDVGGLMSYGPNIEEGFAHAADFVDRIFKGAKPAELPLERPSKPELTINRYTAANLGIAIPADLLKHADRIVG